MRNFIKPRSKSSLNIIQQVYKDFTNNSKRDKALCDKALMLIRKFLEDMTRNEVQKKRLNQKLDYFIIKMICHSITTITKIDDYRGTKDAELLAQIGLKVPLSQFEVLRMRSKEPLVEGLPVEITLKGNYDTTDRSICTTINILH